PAPSTRSSAKGPGRPARSRARRWRRSVAVSASARVLLLLSLGCGTRGPVAASRPAEPGPELLAPRRTILLADRVRLALPRSWYPDLSYAPDLSFHEVSAKTEGSTRTLVLVNASGVAIRPVKLSLGNLDVLGVERIEARFGAVGAGGASVVAEGK